jgi:hypothetical protein
MTWKLYALTSGGAVLVTALAAFVAPAEPRPEVPSAEPQAVDRTGTVVDLAAQADRLKAKLAVVSSYRQPERDAFRFGTSRRVVQPFAPPPASEAPPVVSIPSRPPYGLAGMATTVVDGAPQRTAILSSLQGVSLVKEGETLDTGYRVVSITEDAVILESTTNQTQTTLRLSNTDQPR